MSLQIAAITIEVLGGAYVRTPATKRRFPFGETLAALIAFAALGLD